MSVMAHGSHMGGPWFTHGSAVLPSLGNIQYSTHGSSMGLVYIVLIRGSAMVLWCWPMVLHGSVAGYYFCNAGLRVSHGAPISL